MENKLVVIEASQLDYQIFDAFCKEFDIAYSDIFHNWVSTLVSIVQLNKDEKTRPLAQAAVDGLRGSNNV